MLADRSFSAFVSLQRRARNLFRVDIPGSEVGDSISVSLRVAIVESGVIHLFATVLKIRCSPVTGVGLRAGRRMGLGDLLRSGVMGLVRLQKAY